MKTQYRVLLLMLGLLSVAAVGLTVLSRSEHRHANDLYQDVVDERQRLFAAVYRLDGEPQAALATDYTYWDDMVNFIKKPTKQWSSDNLDTALATYNVDGIWVFKTTGSLVYETSSNHQKLDLPLSADQIKSAFTKQHLTHFFVRTQQGVMELRGATIHPSSDPGRTTPAQGYFFTGRVYNLAYRQRLGAELKSDVSLTDSRSSGHLPAPSSGQVVLGKDLLGPDGKAVSRLEVSSDAPAIRDIYQLSDKRLENFIVIVIPCLLGLLWFLTRYVTEPLKVISGTLKSQDPAPLEKLETKHTEFGQIAALLGDYFRQNRIQLREAHARLRASINGINIGFLMTDVNKEITMVNDAARKILFDDPKRSREVSLAEINQLLPKIELARTIESAMTSITSHSLGVVQYQEKFLRIYVAPVSEVPNKAPVLGCIVLIEDVTLEISLNRARDEFFSIASHELRTPLTVIMGNASMINEQIVPKVKNQELAGMSQDIYDSSQRLIQMVNDFLDTSRLEQNRIKFEIEPVDLVKLLEDLVKEYKGIVAKQKLTLKFEHVNGTAGPVLVRADAAKLQQVLINLLSNALTFTQAGGITIRLDSHPDYASVLVSDSGKGIPAERHHLLFKKFQQAEENILSRDAAKSVSSTIARDTTHGTGLGLYISKLLMEGMGGLIRLERSEVGRGTTFSLTLQTAKPAQTKTSREEKGQRHAEKVTLD